MSHPITLGSQIFDVVAIGRYLDGHVLYDLQAVCLQTDTLGGVVGHQPHLMDMEMAEASVHHSHSRARRA